MEYLDRVECLQKLRDYLYSGKIILKAPELTPNFLDHVYELLWLERSLIIQGGHFLDDDGKLIASKKTAYEGLLVLIEAILLRNSENFIPRPVLASYLKRLSRFSLVANVNYGMWLFPFLFNIFKKYGNAIMFMIHQDPEICSSSSRVSMLVLQDPFLEEVQNPANTKVEESSLWELDVMTHHFFPKISSFTKIMNENFKGRLAFPLDKYTRKTPGYYLQDTISSAREEKQGYTSWDIKENFHENIFTI